MLGACCVPDTGLTALYEPSHFTHKVILELVVINNPTPFIGGEMEAPGWEVGEGWIINRHLC